MSILLSNYYVFIFQVKAAYINFLNHCYIDTEVEMKEIYASPHMWNLFQNFLEDMGRVRYYYIIGSNNKWSHL